MAKVNKQPVAMRMGTIVWDKNPVANISAANFVISMRTALGFVLGDMTEFARNTGMAITGTITEYRTNNRWLDFAKALKENRETVEFTIQAVVDDPASDIPEPTQVTLLGCVVTGDLPVVNLDAMSDDFNTQQISFHAADFEYSA